MKTNPTIILCSIILLCSINNLIIAQTTNVDRLEKRIADLEKRVAYLEQKLSVSQQPSKSVVPKSKDRTVWRMLEKGMTKSQVRELLGEPLTIDSSIITYWYYSKQTFYSYVIFNDNGIMGWKEPE